MPTAISRVNPWSDSSLIATARSACTTASSQAPARYSARASEANPKTAVLYTPSRSAVSATAAKSARASSRSSWTRRSWPRAERGCSHATSGSAASPSAPAVAANDSAVRPL